jgi:patatin-related protein
LRFRTVFHFNYHTERMEDEEGKRRIPVNDFDEANDPFLAYAARCTSSFPFAFEPMQLQDIEKTVKMTDFEDSRYRYNPQTWSRFYRDYKTEADGDFSTRSFGDGGYLDNKPFSYATDELLRRRADQPVDRKLIYIDPTPEHPTNADNEDERPNAIENSMSALTNIPRYEPIREDLERVIKRNRLIQRIRHITDDVKLIVSRRRQGVKDWQKDPQQWAAKYFDRDLIEWFGLSYVAYH